MFQLLVNTTNEKPSNVRRYILNCLACQPKFKNLHQFVLCGHWPRNMGSGLGPLQPQLLVFGSDLRKSTGVDAGSSGSPSPQGDAAAKRKATRRMSSQASMKSSGGSSGNWMIFGG